MLHFRSYRHYPDAFTNNREQRYLTPAETAAFSQLKGPAARAPWLLLRLTAKALVGRYLSDEFDVFFPDNALDVTGTVPSEGRCERLQVMPAGMAQRTTLDTLIVRCSMGEDSSFCAVEPTRPGKRFSLATQPIDSGFPFFQDDVLAEEEIVRLADVEEDMRNGQVAACLAVKRALLCALTLDGAPNIDETDIVVEKMAYGDTVPVRCPEGVLGQREIFAWTDIIPGHACAYVALLDPSFSDHESLADDVEWMVDPREE